MHDICPIRDAKCLSHVVIGHQHPDSSLLQVKHDLLNLGDGNRIDAGERLVEQDEPRRHDERPGNLCPPPFPPGQRKRRRLGQRRQAKLGQQLRRPPPPCRRDPRRSSPGSPGCSARPSGPGRSMAPGADSRFPCAPARTSGLASHPPRPVPPDPNPAPSTRRSCRTSWSSRHRSAPAVRRFRRTPPRCSRAGRRCVRCRTWSAREYEEWTSEADAVRSPAYRVDGRAGADALCLGADLLVAVDKDPIGRSVEYQRLACRCTARLDDVHRCASRPDNS